MIVTSGSLARSVERRQQSWKEGCRSLGEPGQGSIPVMTDRATRRLLQTVADPLVPDMPNNQHVDMLIYSVLFKLKDVSSLIAQRDYSFLVSRKDKARPKWWIFIFM